MTHMTFKKGAHLILRAQVVLYSVESSSFINAYTEEKPIDRWVVVPSP